MTDNVESDVKPEQTNKQTIDNLKAHCTSSNIFWKKDAQPALKLSLPQMIINHEQYSFRFIYKILIVTRISIGFKYLLK